MARTAKKYLLDDMVLGSVNFSQRKSILKLNSFRLRSMAAG